MYLTKKNNRLSRGDKTRISDEIVEQFNKKAKVLIDVDFGAETGRPNFHESVRVRCHLDCIDIDVELEFDVVTIVSCSVFPLGSTPFEDAESVTLTDIKLFEVEFKYMQSMEEDYEVGGLSAQDAQDIHELVKGKELKF